jgi:hypothetical protein
MPENQLSLKKQAAQLRESYSSGDRADITGTVPDRILDERIFQYARGGYRVIHRSDYSAQLLRPKRFSFLWAVIWFLFFGIGILVYFAYYFAKKEKTIYIAVTSSGSIRQTAAGGVSVLGWMILTLVFILLSLGLVLLFFPFLLFFPLLFL